MRGDTPTGRPAPTEGNAAWIRSRTERHATGTARPGPLSRRPRCPEPRQGTATAAGRGFPARPVLPAEGARPGAPHARDRPQTRTAGCVSALGLCATKELSPAGDVGGCSEVAAGPLPSSEWRRRRPVQDSGRGGQARQWTAGAPPPQPHGLPLSRCPPPSQMTPAHGDLGPGAGDPQGPGSV